MCGIVGIVANRGRVTDEQLSRATATLHHRGPDGRGQWTNARKTVGLGHTRLAIMDPQTGVQPISNEDGTVHIVVNGEFYDFERIRRDLEGRGHRFTTRSDSEIALHLYEEYGPGCLAHLRGEFAFIIWDERNQVLFAVRDHTGIKPLYYAVHDGTLHLASEVKALFAAGVPPRWDLDQVFTSAAFHVPFSPMSLGRTLFDGIQQVPPGHHLVAVNGSIRITEYWDWDFALKGSQERLSFEDNIARVQSEVQDAVRLRLRADVPVGCYLSGGLDSTAILALATPHAPPPIRVFTMQFAEAEYDESALAEQIARQYNATYQPILVTPDAMADTYEQSIWHAESFMWTTNTMAKYVLSAGVRDAGYKVVLSGQGADELFAGYPMQKIDMALEAAGKDPGDPPGMPLGSLPPYVADSLANVKKLLGWIPTTMNFGTRQSVTVWELLSDQMRDSYQGRDGNALLLMGLDVERRMRGRDTVAQGLYLGNKTMLPEYVMSVVGDRPEMANAVESRVPFLDHHLIDHVTRMPSGHLVQNNVEKFLLREAMKPWIPDHVYKQVKKPFLAPPPSFLPGSRLAANIRDILAGDLPAFFDKKRVRKFVDELPPVTVRKFRTPVNPDDVKFIAADMAMMFLSSMCLLERRFSITTA